MEATIHRKAWLMMVVFMLGMACSCFAGQVITVNDNGPADFNNIQDAINDSNDGDVILVAQGTYNENISFNGKNIILTSTEPNDSNVVKNTVIQGDGTTSVVIFSGNEDSSCKLAGFTITGGAVQKPKYGGGIRGNGSTTTIEHCIISSNWSEHYGGGIHDCDGLISDCNFIGNDAHVGGGLCGCDGQIDNCVIKYNTADSGAALEECHAWITNCTITNNSIKNNGNNGALLFCYGQINNCTISYNKGGGVIACRCSVSNSRIEGNTGYTAGLSCCTSVTDCTIIGNNGFSGGGLANCKYVRNCRIIGNSATYGGAIYNCSNALYNCPNIINCTISGNTASEDGGGIYCYGTETNITNCILWDNTASRGNQIALFEMGICNSFECIFFPSFITVSYCNDQGGQTEVYSDANSTVNWESGNIDVDPLFADADVNEYHLQSQAGRWDANSQSWVQDNVTSPCIDKGDITIPIGLEPFPNGGIINMGAYGGTSEASKSYFGQPVCGTVMAGDINGDCEVNSKDFALMALHWLEER